MAAEKGRKEASREMAPYRRRGLPGVFDEMDKLMERFMGRPSFWPSAFRWPEEMEMPQPMADIYEDANNVILKAELPGMKKEDLDVNISEDMISISGEKKKEEKVEQKDYYRLERSYGSFSRSFMLPAGVQSSKAQAKFKDGVLEITIPKTQEAKKRKVKVSIQ